MGGPPLPKPSAQRPPLRGHQTPGTGWDWGSPGEEEQLRLGRVRSRGSAPRGAGCQGKGTPKVSRDPPKPPGAPAQPSVGTKGHSPPPCTATTARKGRGGGGLCHDGGITPNSPRDPPAQGGHEDTHAGLGVIFRVQRAGSAWKGAGRDGLQAGSPRGVPDEPWEGAGRGTPKRPQSDPRAGPGVTVGTAWLHPGRRHIRV